MACSDPAITYLKSYGYNVVRLPKAGLRPLQLLSRQQKDLDRFGELITVFIPDSPDRVPSLSLDVPAANISGKRTSNLSLGIGLTVLGNLLGAMGGSTPGLDVTYKQAKSIAFEFIDVLEDNVEVAQLDQYLAASDVNPLSRQAQLLLEADDVYVITATIKSAKFSVEALSSNETGVGLNVPEIQGIVGGNVTVTAQSEVSSKLTYEGKVPLVFGFQAVRLFYDQGVYTAIKPLETGRTAARALDQAPADGADRYVSEAPLVTLPEL